MNVQIILLDKEAGAFGTWTDIDEAIKSLQALANTRNLEEVDVRELVGNPFKKDGE